MIKRDTCYFCTSTFQLFSILPLAASRKETADLYIDPQFRDAGVIAKRIRKLGLFNKVRVINSEKIYNKYYTHRKGFLNHIEIARSYLYVDSISAMILGENVCYKNIFVSTKAYMPRMVILHFIKHKCRIKVNFFDDGLASYFGDDAYAPQKGDVMIRKLLFGKKAVDLSCDRYLLSPELFKVINPDFKHRIYAIENIWGDPVWTDRLKKIFNVDDIAPIDRRAVILDDPVDELFTPENAQKMNDIFKTVIESFGSEDTIIKKHPRSRTEPMPGCTCYPDYGIPFEMICIGSDLDSKVIISYRGTAAATPKTLLGQEPYVILLYKLVESKLPSTSGALADRYFESIRSIYSDKSKVMIPKDTDELKTMLQSLNSKE